MYPWQVTSANCQHCDRRVADGERLEDGICDDCQDDEAHEREKMEAEDALF